MILIIAILLLISLVFVFNEIHNKKLLQTVTKAYRGTRTERDLVLKLLKSGIPASNIFHDLYLKTFNGNHCQIDLVVVSDFGLFVFEVKNYKGWIYGTGYKDRWTQVLAYGKQKYRFYNPIIQNSKHIVDLKKKLPRETIPYISVIVFYGDCVLIDISFVPEGTFIVKSDRVLDALKTIKKKNNQAADYNKAKVYEVLKEAVSEGDNNDVQVQHANRIKDMLGMDRIFD